MMKTRVTAAIETVTASAHSETGMKARDVITITETGTIVIEIVVIVTVGIAVSATTVTGIIAGAVPVYVSKTKMATFTAGITEDLRNGPPLVCAEQAKSEAAKLPQGARRPAAQGRTVRIYPPNCPKLNRGVS
jgi:hypothetical protein